MLPPNQAPYRSEDLFFFVRIPMRLLWVILGFVGMIFFAKSFRGSGLVGIRFKRSMEVL